MDRDQIAHEITRIKNQLYRFASDEDLRSLRHRVDRIEADNHLKNEVREQRDLLIALDGRIEAIEKNIYEKGIRD